MALRTKSGLINSGLFLAVLPLFANCSSKTIEAENEATVQESMPPANNNLKTACLSFQGNGPYFSSHIGALIALLENKFVPVFAAGGSSGAIVASMTRALTENPTLALNGKFDPQFAASVLASSSPVIESILFLPRLTTPARLIESIDAFLGGKAFVANWTGPSYGMVNADSIFGQATLIVEFYRSANFTEVRRKNSLAAKEDTVSKLWKDFADAIDVTPEQFTEAILNNRDTLIKEEKGDLVQIQDRFFRMFRSRRDTPLNEFQQQQKQWNALLQSQGRKFGLESAQGRAAVMHKLLNAVRPIESLDSLYSTLSGKFMLPDPDRVYRAFLGSDSKTRKIIEIPSNTIIHTTARRAQKQSGEWHEKRGLASLHQIYFTGKKLAPVALKTLLDPKTNPLRPVAGEGESLPVLPSERIVVSEQNLSSAIAATSAEAAAFVRSPITLDDEANRRLGWITNNESLVGYGGWLQKISLSTALQFEQCKPNQVDVYFYTADGDEVGEFSLSLFRGLLGEQALRNQNSSSVPSDLREIENAIERTKLLTRSNRSLSAKLGHIPLDYRHNAPLGTTNADLQEVNIAIRTNRRATILATYQLTSRILINEKLQSSPMKLWEIPLEQIRILESKTAEEVENAANAALPSRGRF